MSKEVNEMKKAVEEQQGSAPGDAEGARRATGASHRSRDRAAESRAGLEPLAQTGGDASSAAGRVAGCRLRRDGGVDRSPPGGPGRGGRGAEEPEGCGTHAGARAVSRHVPSQLPRSLDCPMLHRCGFLPEGARQRWIQQHRCSEATHRENAGSRPRQDRPNERTENLQTLLPGTFSSDC